MYEKLKKVTNETPIVDDHAHLAMEQAMIELNAKLGLEMPPHRPEDSYMTPMQSSFGFPLLAELHKKVFLDFYRFAEADLENPEKRDALTEAYAIQRGKISDTLAMFMKAGNVEHIISVDMYTSQEIENCPHTSVMEVVDSLLYPFDNEYLCVHESYKRPMSRMHLGNFEKRQKVWMAEYGLTEPFTYEEYMKFTDQVLDGIKEKGHIGYKFLSAYIRSLKFDKPNTDPKILFDSAKDGDIQAYDKFQDHVAWTIMRKAAENGLPVQFHTAMIDGYTDYADPLSMNQFLQDDTTYNAKIVLLHSGFPMFDHAKTLALATKPFTQNNVYLDISGRIMFGNDPRVISRMLCNFLEVPSLHSKIMYGSDAILGDRFIYTCSVVGREAVYLALASYVQEGIFGEERAIEIAKGILRNNAIRLYNLPLQIL